MSRKPSAYDADNPEWTDEDFTRARLPNEVLPSEILGQFPTRGLQKAATKVPISLRLSRDVLERLKASGPGWQTRIDELLRKQLGM